MKIMLSLLCALISLNSLNAAASRMDPFAVAFLRCVTTGEVGATKAMLNALNHDVVGQRRLVNTPDATGKTALMYAIINGNKDTAAEVSARGADLNARDGEGKTALMHACINYHTDMAKALITLGVDVNVQDKDGWTALMLAAQKTSIEIAELLLLNAADCTLKNTENQTAEDIAQAELATARTLSTAYAPDIMARLEDMPELISGRRPITVGSVIDAVLPSFRSLQIIHYDAATMHDAMVMAMRGASLSDATDKGTTAAKAIKDAAAQRRGTNNKNRRKKK